MPVRLVQRRLVPVPTALGALLLAVSVGILGLALALGIPRFLAPTEPVRTGTLVVEGWMDGEELRRAVEVYRRGAYSRLVVTGGPIADAPRNCGGATYAERGGQFLRDLGVVEPELVVVPSATTERDRTYRSALAVKRWLDSQAEPVTAVDIASHGMHARRSRALFGMALGRGVDVGVVSVLPSEYDPDHWWRTSEGVKDLLGEATGYAWMTCCFRPYPDPGLAGGEVPPSRR